MAIVGTSVLPLFPMLVRSTGRIKLFSKVVILTEYIGDYVFRWANFPPELKIIPISSYADGQPLNPQSGNPMLPQNYRVNNLVWAEQMTDISDKYKTTITIYEANSTDRAVVKVVVWYDDDDDNQVDGDNILERAFTFSTIVCEKLN
ncbi:hypothetical protein ACFL96_03690 [Thermoproteota archaeon]